MDIKDTLSAAISDLRLDMQAMRSRLENVEETTDRHDTVIHEAQQTLDAHSSQLRDLHRHLEDLENRGRRHNIRIRGLSQSVEAAHLTEATLAIFNDLLGRPLDTQLEMERLHRALRPKGRDTDPPRDIIGCIVNFKLKEEILRRAKNRGRILFHGMEIKLFQELSQITLQKRKDLRPPLEALRERHSLQVEVSILPLGRYTQSYSTLRAP